MDNWKESFCSRKKLLTFGLHQKLRRGLKACQLQFGRLRSQSPYKEMLKEAQYKWAKEDWFDEEVEAEVDESDDAQADNFGV